MSLPIIVILAVGCIFMIVLLIIALAVPEPTEYQIFIFRVILGIAAAGAGAAIPGLLEIQGKVLSFSIQASGALACFIMIYLINPPKLISKQTHTSSGHPEIGPPTKIRVPKSIEAEENDEGEAK